MSSEADACGTDKRTEKTLSEGRPAWLGLGLLERAESDRVTQVLYSRDAVLPGAARFAVEDVGRPGRRRELRRFEGLAFAATEAEAAGRGERDADDAVEHRRVAMPADARAG